MLAKYWRLRGLWTADQTLTYNSDARVEVNWYGWKLTAGALVYSAESTDDFGFVAAETWATTVQKEITVVDNSSNLYLGVKGTLEVKADADSTDGTMALYLEESTDNTVWPSDLLDFDCALDLRLVAVLTMSTDAIDETRATNFEF